MSLNELRNYLNLHIPYIVEKFILVTDVTKIIYEYFDFDWLDLFIMNPESMLNANHLDRMTDFLRHFCKMCKYKTGESRQTIHRLLTNSILVKKLSVLSYEQSTQLGFGLGVTENPNINEWYTCLYQTWPSLLQNWLSEQDGQQASFPEIIQFLSEYGLLTKSSYTMLFHLLLPILRHGSMESIHLLFPIGFDSSLLIKNIITIYKQQCLPEVCYSWSNQPIFYQNLVSKQLLFFESLLQLLLVDNNMTNIQNDNITSIKKYILTLQTLLQNISQNNHRVWIKGKRRAS